MVSPLEPAAPESIQPAEALSMVPPRRAVRRFVSAPQPSAEQSLVARAAEVLKARARRPPARLLLPGFARDVDLVRWQLGPLRDPAMLVASYERESARLAALRRLASDPAAPPGPRDPLEAAYAVRWLELSAGGVALPTWATFVGADADGAAVGRRANGANVADKLG